MLWCKNARTHWCAWYCCDCRTPWNEYFDGQSACRTKPRKNYEAYFRLMCAQFLRIESNTHFTFNVVIEAFSHSPFIQLRTHIHKLIQLKLNAPFFFAMYFSLSFLLFLLFTLFKCEHTFALYLNWLFWVVVYISSVLFSNKNEK